MIPRSDGRHLVETDWRNWRRRIYRPAAERAGLVQSRPYDLRHSFVSLLICEGRTVVEVAEQAGHSVETCSRDYVHVFKDYDPAKRITASERIMHARVAVAEARDSSSAVDGEAGQLPVVVHEMLDLSRRPDVLIRAMADLDAVDHVDRRERSGKGLFGAGGRTVGAVEGLSRLPEAALDVDE